jgi:predicted nucleotidyltransferase
MSIAKHNLTMIYHVAMRLGDLVDSVVFLGGATTTLLITDTAAGDARPTKDVDVIVEIATTAEYHRLAEQLRGRGFSEDTSEGAPLCRWLIDGIIVDVMPTDEATLGFSNRWYREAFEHATLTVVEGVAIRVVTAPFFLATKLEAFRTRGHEDFMASHDLEDIISLVDGRSELVEEVGLTPAALQLYLATTFRQLLANPLFLDALPCHLPGDAASQQRRPLLLERLRRISAFA